MKEGIKTENAPLIEYQKEVIGALRHLNTRWWVEGGERNGFHPDRGNQ